MHAPPLPIRPQVEAELTNGSPWWESMVCWDGGGAQEKRQTHPIELEVASGRFHNSSQLSSYHFNKLPFEISSNLVRRVVCQMDWYLDDLLVLPEKCEFSRRTQN